jgi:hypothetical protein
MIMTILQKTVKIFGVNSSQILPIFIVFIVELQLWFFSNLQKSQIKHTYVKPQNPHPHLQLPTFTSEPMAACAYHHSSTSPSTTCSHHKQVPFQHQPPNQERRKTTQKKPPQGLPQSNHLLFTKTTSFTNNLTNQLP